MEATVVQKILCPLFEYISQVFGEANTKLLIAEIGTNPAFFEAMYTGKRITKPSKAMSMCSGLVLFRGFRPRGISKLSIRLMEQIKHFSNGNQVTTGSFKTFRK